MSGKRSLRLLAGLGFALLAPALAGAADLANARLLIAGSRLTVSPESQTVPFDGHVLQSIGHDRSSPS